MARLRAARPRPDSRLPWLRRRTAHLLKLMLPNERAMIRLLPALITGRFRRPGFDREPPGMLRAPTRRRWGKLAELLDWQAPLSFTNGKPLVASVLVCPRGRGHFQVIVVPVTDTTPDDQRLAPRVDAIASLMSRKTPRLSIAIREQPDAIDWVFAGLIAGEHPGLASSHSHPDIDRPLWVADSPISVDLPTLLAQAPTPLTRALSLLADPSPQHPLDTLVFTPPIDASPEAFLAAWTGAPAASECVSLLRIGDAGLEQLIATSRSLQRAAVRAVRRAPVDMREAMRTLLNRELLSSRVPKALKEPFEAALRARRPEDELIVEEHRACINHACIAEGRSDAEAEIRAACESAQLATTQATRRLAELHGRGQARGLIYLGQRDIHRAVLVGHRGRPRLLEADTKALLRWLLTQRARGIPVELEGRRGANPTIAALIARVLATPRDARPLALEFGSRIIVSTSTGCREFAARVYLQRPRQVQLLSEAPSRMRALASVSTPPGIDVIHAFALSKPDGAITILYADAYGSILREDTTREHLAQTLEEANALLRSMPSPCALSVTVESQLELLARQQATPSVEPIKFELLCESPATISASFEGERFGHSPALPWDAAAELALSRWPLGARGHVGVSHLSFGRQAIDHPALWALAVRALVVRKVSTRIGRLARVLEAA